MTATLLLLVGLAAAQGDALRIEVENRPELEAVHIEWGDREVPLVADTDGWWTIIGIDLDREPGTYEAVLEYRFGDGRIARETAEISVLEESFPTTELTVESRYVELNADDQARAARESAEIAALYATLTEEPLFSEPFASPIPGASGGRNFGHRRVFNGQPRAPHSGADLSASTGTPIHAANRGRVVLAKNLFFSGNAVFLDHGLGIYTVYLHLSEIDVEVGDVVEKGQVVGLAGATGRVTGPHLHWGVRVLDARVDPFSLLEL